MMRGACGMLLVLAAVCPCAAWSSEGGGPVPVVADPAAFHRDLETLAQQQRQLRMLEQQLKLLELQKRLGELQGALARPEGGGERRPSEERDARGGPEERRRDVETTALVATALPRVVSVSGAGGAMRAVVLIPFLGERTVAVGDELDRWTVDAIDERGVRVRDAAGAQRWLAFGTRVPALPPFQFEERRSVAGGEGGAPAGPIR